MLRLEWRISREGLVSVGGNFYSVPDATRRRVVEVHTLADRLGHDAAMCWIVGGGAVTKQAASTSQMGRFETEILAQRANLTALTDLSGRWIDAVHTRRPTRVVVLDMDSSVSPAAHDSHQRGA